MNEIVYYSYYVPATALVKQRVLALCAKLFIGFLVA